MRMRECFTRSVKISLDLSFADLFIDGFEVKVISSRFILSCTERLKSIEFLIQLFN